MTPTKACEEKNFKSVLNLNIKRYHKMKSVREKVKFSIGDMVRVSIDKRKELFTRSYQLQNSYQKYHIYKIVTKNTIFPKYYIKHVESDQIIKGGYFYSWELVKCTVKTFRGNIIKTRVDKNGKKQHLFSYKGYSKKFDEWKDDDAGDITNNLG